MMSETLTEAASPEAELTHQVRDALSHLYDYTHLQRHPLALLFFPHVPSEGPNRAQRLHRFLLEAVEELSPPQHVPFDSHKWRGCRILSDRYVEGQSPQEIMEELAISRRQYFREQRKALQALVSLLREKLPGKGEAAEDQNSLLQAEAERVMGQRQSIVLNEIVEGALQAIRPLGEEKGVTISYHMEAGLPTIYANRTLLRQIFIQALSRLITSPEVCRVHLDMQRRGRWIITEARGISANEERVVGEAWPVASVQQLVEMLGGEWRSHAEEACLRFALPTNEPRTLLAIDDNEGLIRLLRRYLAEHNVQVIEATNGSDALRLARELQPDAITLDVMMPSQDGWEVLQHLKSEPSTQHIPIIICSVLDDPELAFSLGATAYLKKPVSQADLVEALGSLGGE